MPGPRISKYKVSTGGWQSVCKGSRRDQGCYARLDKASVLELEQFRATTVSSQMREGNADCSAERSCLRPLAQTFQQLRSQRSTNAPLFWRERTAEDETRRKNEDNAALAKTAPLTDSASLCPGYSSCLTVHVSPSAGGAGSVTETTHGSTLGQQALDCGAIPSTLYFMCLSTHLPTCPLFGFLRWGSLCVVLADLNSLCTPG